MFTPRKDNRQASSFAEFNIKSASAISMKNNGFLELNHNLIHR
jgi:hypothetical protein